MSMIANFLRVSEQEFNEFLNDSQLLEDRIYENEALDEDKNFMDIEKSWNGIFYLLEKIETTKGELTRAIFSHQVIDEQQDMGYGPAQYLTIKEVKALNGALSVISIEDLRQKYDASDMNESGVYPSIWDEGESALEYLSYNFTELQRFYAEAASNNQAVIMIMN